MAKKVLRVADKPTLDEIINMLKDDKYGLEMLINSINNSTSRCSNIMDYTLEDVRYTGKQYSISQLPYAFYRGSAVVLNNEIHILGGSGNQTAHYKWDGTSWTEVSTLPYNFCYGSAVVYNDEIHILGGNNTAHRRKHYKWDGTSWTEVSTLPYNFYLGSAVVLNNAIHILGGQYNAVTAKSHTKWNGSTWSSVSTLPCEFHYGSAVVFGGKIHILGGYSGDGTIHYSFSSGSSWIEISKLPVNFQYGTAVVYNGEIYILGGNNAPSKNYAKHGGSWISTIALPYGFYQGCAVVYNNEIHLLGGNSYTTNHYKLTRNWYKPHISKESSFMFEGDELYSQYNLYPISNNCIVDGNHLKVISDGIVQFGAVTDSTDPLRVTIRRK